MMTLTEKEILFVENKIKKIDLQIKCYEEFSFPISKIFRLDLILVYLIFKYRKNRIIKTRNELVEVLKIIKEINDANKL